MILKNQRQFVIDNKNVGTLEFSKSKLFICNMDLDKHNLSHQGLGRKYYEALEDFAKTKGIKEIFGQLADNQNVEGFWIKMGFQIIRYNTKEWEYFIQILEKYFDDDTRILNLKWDLIYKKINS